MYRLLAAACAAIVILMACSSSSVPQETLVGQLRSAPIRIPSTVRLPATVTLRFNAASRVTIKPGSGLLIDGTIQYNLDELNPIVTVTGQQVTVEQRTNSLSFPNDTRNEWDLRLGSTMPMVLNIEAGTYSGTLDLGGVRLRELRLAEGATTSAIDFSQPNAETMEQLLVQTGASTMALTNLANANATQIRVASGSGDYLLDFGGTLLRTTQVAVQSGVSSMTIRVPATTPARITLKGPPSTVNASGFTQTERQYTNAAWDASRPHIDLMIDMGVGTLNLDSR